MQYGPKRLSHVGPDRREGGVVQTDRVGDIVHPLAVRLLSSGQRQPLDQCLRLDRDRQQSLGFQAA